MNGIARRPVRASLAALVLAVQSYGVSAYADPSADDCVAANERAIDLRGRHQLLAARAALLVCADAKCPAEVRDECARSVESVNGAIPTIVFEAKDARGHDVDGVSVTMDGNPFVAQLQGVAVAVDPGKHTFSFQAPGEPPVSREILIVEGAKERRETITLGVLREPEPARRDVGGRDGNLQRVLGWSAVGAGVIGVGLGVFFEVKRSDKLSQADAICPQNDCTIPGLTHTQSDAEFNARIHDLTSDANAAGVGAVIAFVAGGAFIAGGLAVAFTAPSAERPVAVVPVVAPGLVATTMTGRF